MSKVIRKEITCPRCKGIGMVFDVSECVFTFGIDYIDVEDFINEMNYERDTWKKD